MSRINLATYRMKKAKEILIEAKDNFEQEHYELSVNRSYYAMFTSARALLALKELDSSKHSGVIALFNQNIIKTGLFSKELGKYLKKAKRTREDADYGDFVELTRDDAIIYLKNAREFVKESEKIMQKMLKEE